MSEIATVAESQDGSRGDVARALRAGDRFLLTTHEGPDGCSFERDLLSVSDIRG